MLNRREFLTVSGGVLVGLGALGGSELLGRGAKTSAVGAAAAAPTANGRTLVIIYLGGGNDGLNTVAPYGIGKYYDLRPALGIKESEALPLTGKLGLHPNLKGLKRLYDAGKLAVLQGVGYPDPDRSHFRSFDIWATAQTKGVSPAGWLGRYLDKSGGAQKNPLRAVSVGSSIAKPMVGSTGAAVAIDSVENFNIRGAGRAVQAIREMYGLGDGPLAAVRGRGENAIAAADAVQHLSKQYKAAAAYPDRNGLARNLQLMVRLLAGGAGSQVMYTTFGGFDEHASEKTGHDRLMKEFDEAVSAFQADLESHGLGDRVVTFVHSEFGRRAQENASGGTDHGAASCSFLVGKSVKGGLLGDHPSLTDLLDGDLRMGLDFRSIYATLLEHWLDGRAEEVLGQRFDKLPLLRA